MHLLLKLFFKTVLDLFKSAHSCVEHLSIEAHSMKTFRFSLFLIRLIHFNTQVIQYHVSNLSDLSVQRPVQLVKIGYKLGFHVHQFDQDGICQVVLVV